ncbi:MAG: PHP domain-containing protein [Candidatus Omnitrophota bacterium]
MQKKIDKEFIDLHVHTNFSDSSFSPEEVVAYALKKKIRAIAITDHDCVDGIAPALEAAASSELEIIPGIELTAVKSGMEIHILGLLIDWDNQKFAEKLKKIRDDRVERMHQMIEKLKSHGIEINPKDIFPLSQKNGAIGRLHLARALVKDGVVHSVQAAFNRFIGEHKPCYVKKSHVEPQDAFKMIQKLNGIAILAHPGLMMADFFIPDFVEQGLMGIEIYHTKHSDKITHYYKNIAKKYNLLISGGSDCHGMGKGEPLIGKVKVPYEVLEKLKQAKLLKYGK